MSKNSINVRDEDGLKARLQALAHDYRMGFSDLVREILEQGETKWRQALDEEKAGLVL